MGSASKASLIVAASVGAVEALKDQAGLCRWNYALKSLYHHAHGRMASISKPTRMTSSSSSSSSSSSMEGGNKTGFGNGFRAKRSEESLRKAYYLICWGPN